MKTYSDQVNQSYLYLQQSKCLLDPVAVLIHFFATAQIRMRGLTDIITGKGSTLDEASVVAPQIKV